MSKADYLKKYMTDDTKEKEKKKRKKKKVKGNIAIIDNDVNWDEMKADEHEEDAPQVVNIVDSRSDAVKRKQDGWKKIGGQSRDDSPKRSIKRASPRRARKDSSPSDSSPPRRKALRKDSESPPRRQRKNSSSSPPRRKRKDSSSSPPRRSRKDSDTSPPRRRRVDSDSSPPRRSRKDSDSSPQRRKRVDSDDSPPRRSRKDSDSSPPRRKRADSDASPPRRKRKDSDSSPPKRKRVDSDESPPRRKRVDSDSDDEQANSRQKMMDGTKSGLNTKSEFLAMKPQMGKNSNLQKIIDEAKNAETIYRDKSGKKRDFKKEEELDEAERARKEEELKNYKVWNKGKKQLEQKEENIQSYLKEIEKPLARYKDDKDFNDMKKAEMFADDPMYEYMMGKNKTKTKKARQQSNKKMYTGSSTAPNRFGILPGYRWDGVDRSTGFETKLFTYHNEKRIQVTEAWRANTDDF